MLIFVLILNKNQRAN